MSAVSSPSATRAAIERLVAPKTIAILGASSDRTKVGALPLSFLRKYGYAGRIFPVNPGSTEIDGLGDDVHVPLFRPATGGTS